jgi:predicted DNA-binding protein with PD1-like motif
MAIPGALSLPAMQGFRSLPASEGAMKLEPLRLTPGTDLLLALAALPRQRGERAGMVISGIGSLAPVRLRFAGRGSATPMTGVHEILSLAGSLSLDGAHLHLSVADGDGRVTGGHLLEGSLVRTTAELLLGWLPDWTFRRVLDPQTGFRELQITRSDPEQPPGHHHQPLG